MEPRMNQAEKYHSNNFLQARDIEELLHNYKQKMKWEGKRKIIDIGCGPGNITYKYLFPLISKDAELLGIDISEPMIQFAKSHYSHSRLSFETFDVLDPKIEEKYAMNFDMAFSFYSFHWIQDQRTVMKNLYSILKPGSEILFIVVVNAMNYEMYEILGESPKWSSYMKNYKHVISSYRKADPVPYTRNLMQDAGFHINECSLASRSYTFPSKQAFYNWMEAMNPFLENIPKNLAKEYEREWKKIILDNNLYAYNEATDEVTYTHSALTVFAQKPD